MAYINLRGTNHYYEWIRVTENSEALTKPVLVFVHGWAGSARYWESTAHELADRFDCLLYDMRGFGRSPSQQAASNLGVSPYELETYAADLAELLDALNLQRVYLNAHSTGASVVTHFLNLYPERVERAILTCNGIFEYDQKSFSQFHRVAGYVIKFRPRWLAKIPFANRLFMARFLHRSLPDAVSQPFLEDYLLASYEAALGTMLTAVSKQAAEVMPQEFARISVPTLLVAGEHDIIIPAEMGRRAAALNHNVEFVMIPNTAHFPMLEDPIAYLAQVRTFLQLSPTLKVQSS